MRTDKFEIYDQHNSIVGEAFSFLRVNFNFSNVDKKYKSLALLSFNPSEGKTLISINLAISFAKSGVKTLLVDTDFRKPVGVKHLSGKAKKGMSNYLTENIPLNDVIMCSNIENLNYLPCGSKVMNPSALLSSEAFEQFIKKVSNEYDLVIFDTPALSSVIDGYIVASKADSSLLIVKDGEVRMPKLKRAKEQLKKAKANVLGVILNNVPTSEYRKSYEAYDYFIDNLKFSKATEKNKNMDKIINSTAFFLE